MSEVNPIAAAMYGRETAEPGTPVRIGTGVIIRNDAGEILLEKRSDCGMWGLPGGRVEPGESVTESALREVMEETGLEIRITRLVGVYSAPKGRIVTFPDNGDVVQLVDAILEAEITGGELRRSEESEELRFFRKDDLPPDIVPPAQKPVQDYIEGKTGVIA